MKSSLKNQVVSGLQIKIRATLGWDVPPNDCDWLTALSMELVRGPPRCTGDCHRPGKSQSPQRFILGICKLYLYYSLPTLLPTFYSWWDSSGSFFRSLSFEETKPISRMALAAWQFSLQASWGQGLWARHHPWLQGRDGHTVKHNARVRYFKYFSGKLERNNF